MAFDCLIVTNNFPPVVGGAGEVYAALAAAGGGRIGILAASRSYLDGAEIPGWPSHDAAAGYPMARVPAVRPRRDAVGGRLARLGAEAWIRVRLLAAVARMRRRHRFGVLGIADDETVGWLIRPAQRLLGCKVVLWTHGDDLAVQPCQARLRERRRRQFARADAIVAVSAAAAAELCRVYGVPARRVTVIANGIDLTLFRPRPEDPALRARLGLAGRRVIVTVARLVARKGIDRVIAALPSVLAAVPDAHYLVVGEGPQQAELLALAVRCGVAERVTFAGTVGHRDVPAYLALAACFAMPNRRLADGEDEGFGLVFLEANACGVPVLAGRAGGVPEVVADGENGLLVDGEDAVAVADGLIRLLSDAPLAARLAAGGLARAELAGWDRTTARLLALCAGLETTPAGKRGFPAGGA